MKSALVLSGGGALGAAHVGILEALDAKGFRQDFIVGTSAGAIVGALYAASGTKAVNEFLDVLIKTFSNPRDYIRLSTPHKVQSFVENILADFIPHDVSKLKIPFYPVATNFLTGKYEILSKCDLIAGVIASAAYPGVFPIEEIGNKLYIDGGLLANLPAEAAKKLGATYLVGSSIYTLPKIEPEKAKKMNIFGIAERSIDIMQADLASRQAALCDLCFEPQILGSFKLFHINALTEVRDAGRDYARKRFTEIPDFDKDPNYTHNQETKNNRLLNIKRIINETLHGKTK
jgi:NTE family protein